MVSIECIEVLRHTDSRSDQDDMGGRGIVFRCAGRTFSYYFFDGFWRLGEEEPGRDSREHGFPWQIPVGPRPGDMELHQYLMQPTDYEVARLRGQGWTVHPEEGWAAKPLDALQRELSESKELLSSLLRRDPVRLTDRTGYHKGDI